MNKPLASLFLLLVTHSLSVAQQPTSQQSATALPTVIPPSPTAASLGIYGEVGVGYYTGLPDITIPLYQLQGRSITVPIRLQYHASGTRAAENASWVGLGWSLSAGGVITRTIKGLNDFANNGGGSTGYYFAPALPKTTPDQSADPMADKAYYDQIQRGNYDGEPDVYCYNFGTYTGKFVLSKMQDGSTTLLDEQNNLQITYLNGNWQLTDSRGYQYLFATQEVVDNYSYGSSSQEAADNIPLSSLDYQPTNSLVTSAWYLSTITSPSGETVQFEYVKGESLSLLNKSEEQYDRLTLSGGCSNNNVTSSSLQGQYTYYTASKQVIQDVYLRKITFSQGSVEFSTTPREDIEYRNPSKQPAKLSEIIIKDQRGELIKRYALTHTYFDPYDLQRRLKLDAIQEYGRDGLSKPPYTFTYDNPSGLPVKYTKDVDHWGYYNGQSNSRLLPELVVAEYGKVLKGANRKAEVSNLYLKRGVLTAITYPTGGRTVFDYELHDYANLQGDERYKDAPQQALARSYPGNTLDTTDEFDIMDSVAVDLHYAYNEANCAQYGCELRSTYTGLFFVEQKIGTAWNTTKFVANNTPALASDDPPYRTSESRDATIMLLPGHYRIRVWSVPGYTLSMNAAWNGKQLINQRQGGGLRIKSIRNYNGADLTSQRQFIYTVDGTRTGLTSGLLIAKPKYDFYTKTGEIIAGSAGGNVQHCEYQAQYAGRMASSIHALGFSARTGSVAYSKVTELVGPNGEGGKTEYVYYNSPARPMDYTFLPVEEDPWNGKLKQKTLFDASGTKVQQTTYAYQTNKRDSLAAVKTDRPAFLQGSNGGLDGLGVKLYTYPSSWTVLAAQTDTKFSNGQTSVVTQRFTYDDALHKEITRQEISVGASKVHLTRYLYPSDYTDTSGFIGEMKAAHILSLPVEQITSLAKEDGSAETVLAATLMTYGTGSRVGLVDRQWALETNALIPITNFKFTNQATLGVLPSVGRSTSFSLSGKDGHYPAKAAQLMQYDVNGQLQQIRRNQATSTTYLWGYNNTLPVAELRNTSASQVQAALTAAGIDLTQSLTDSQWKAAFAQLRQRLPQAQVTGFTHRPLVGQTSQTDPSGRTITYEYDGLGRLIRTRDEQGRILSQQQYHYAGQ